VRNELSRHKALSLHLTRCGSELVAYSSLRTRALLILRAVGSNLDTPAIYSASHMRSALLRCRISRYSPSAGPFACPYAGPASASQARAASDALYMQWRSSPRLRAGVRAARANIQSALLEAALTPLAFRISNEAFLDPLRLPCRNLCLNSSALEPPALEASSLRCDSTEPVRGRPS
jgi:hypothetical protein